MTAREEARRLLEKITPGDWVLEALTIRAPHPKDPEHRQRVIAKAEWDKGTYHEDAVANAEFIAAAPRLLRALLAASEGEQSQRKRAGVCPSCRSNDPAFRFMVFDENSATTCADAWHRDTPAKESEGACQACGALRQERDKYRLALERHLCKYDMADWVVCAGGHGEECGVCAEADKGQHRHALLVRAERAESSLASAKAEALREAAEIAEGYLHTLPTLPNEMDALDRQAAYSNGTVQRIVAILRQRADQETQG